MSTRRLAAAVAVALASLVATGTGASADTTLDRKLAPAPGTGYVPLQAVRGERYVVRRGGSAKARKGRAGDRRSLLMFAQLTDPQIADEMSPARVDFADPAGGEIRSSWRPQEAMGLQVFDATVRAVNANPRSPVRQGNGRRARLALALTTGDLADNQQLNETQWFRDVLDGRRVDPFSGKPIGPGNECAGASQATIDAINADVAARRYTGVQDYDDYATAPDDRKSGFWDPDVAPPGGTYAAFPRYAGLMERAQEPFTAAGLDVPWYISRGNHDGLIQGNAPASTDLFRSIAIGCLKVFPSTAFDPSQFQGASDDELFAAFGDPNFISQLVASGRSVAPDPERRILSKAEYRQLVGHGFRKTPKAQLDASGGTASYYAFNARPGIRLISLDTVAEGGGDDGNVDDPQYRWLRAELKRARKRDQLVVVFGHHTLGVDGQPARRRGRGDVRHRGRAGLRRRPAAVDADPPRAGRPEDREGAARGHAERDRLRGRPHAPQHRGLQPRPARSRVLGDQHRLAHRLAAAEPPDRHHGQRRRHAVAVRDGARQRGAGCRTTGGPGGGLHAAPAGLGRAHAVLQRPAARGRRPRPPPRPQRGAVVRDPR